VSAAAALEAEVRLYDRLFTDAQPDAGGKDFISLLNPNAKEVVTAYWNRAWRRASRPALPVRAPRLLRRRPRRLAAGKPVFNRIVTLKDSWGPAK
jgi:glutaminyl-tRNA synthetase